MGRVATPLILFRNEFPAISLCPWTPQNRNRSLLTMFVLHGRLLKTATSLSCLSSAVDFQGFLTNFNHPHANSLPTAATKNQNQFVLRDNPHSSKQVSANGSRSKVRAAYSLNGRVHSERGSPPRRTHMQTTVGAQSEHIRSYNRSSFGS